MPPPWPKTNQWVTRTPYDPSLWRSLRASTLLCIPDSFLVFLALSPRCCFQLLTLCIWMPTAVSNTPQAELFACPTNSLLYCFLISVNNITIGYKLRIILNPTPNSITKAEEVWIKLTRATHFSRWNSQTKGGQKANGRKINTTFCFQPGYTTCVILVSRLGIEPTPRYREVFLTQYFNHARNACLA